MAVYLVDTCVWRDFYEDRISKSGTPIGKYATDFFMKILKRKDKILFSEGLLRELGKDYNQRDIDDMLNILMQCNVLTKIDILKAEFLEAKELSEERNLPFIDCLNSVQARNHQAILVTRDEHYFKNLKDIIKAVKPEDFK
jgi:predicted nucleic acid-binding protein